MPARIDLPLIRRRDRTMVSVPTVVRANHPAFTDAPEFPADDARQAGNVLGILV
jgi:hypothetical protein